jgi:ubiquinone biosynthesis protein COQ9
MKIDKEKFIISLLKNIPESADLDEAILNTLSNLKIDESAYYDIKNELFPKGLNSLMYQINLLINKRLSNEKKPLRFKSFRVNEKVKYFTMRRLMIFESLVDKKFFFGKIFKPNLLLNSNKILFKIADEIWFLSGDKSTDYNYYTKRIILMKVYALTFSFFIFDNSKNLERTRNFLDKEIDIVLKFGKFTNKIKNKIRF